MKIANKLIGVFVLFLGCCSASANMMTMENLKLLLSQDGAGEAAGTAYVQGLVDGMLGMDSIYHTEKGMQYEFCKFFEAESNKDPIEHPAYRAKWIVSRWEREGGPMDALAVDVILMYMTKQYACK